MAKEAFDDDYEEDEEERKAALLAAKKLKEKEEKMKERRNKITQLKDATFFLEDTREDEARIKPYQGEHVVEDLSPQELTASISRSLVAENPYHDVNRVIFNFKDGVFQRLLSNSREILLYELEGSLVHVDSPEAQEQEDRLEMEAEWKERINEMNERQKQMIMERVLQKREKKRKEQEAMERGEDLEQPEAEPEPETDAEGTEEGQPASPPPEEAEETGFPDKKLVNRFNYSDRSALTYSALSRDKTTQTIPNPKAGLSAQVSQWIIYDSYQEDYNAAQEAKERERLAKMIMTVKKEDKTAKKPPKGEDPIFKRMAEGIKILERMLNQNTYDNIAQDCQFYEDPGDKYRMDEGVLLPLWEFKYVAAKNVAVTEVKWNPAYKDLFGATFGMMDFTEPNNAGYLCVFTLKNPSYPEFVKHFDSGATCLDFHPRKCFYICVGLHDGSVAVFNMKTPHCDTQYRSPVEKNHRSMVASVLWCDDKRDRQLSFFSAGGDGRISKWLLLQNELLFTPIITLCIDKHDLSLGCKELDIPANPTCLSFHPTDFEIFMVGTALGTIYKCSISYASTYFYQMKAHELPVHRISFNTYIPDIFATCSGDWRIKIWEDGRTEPLFLFNLENPVGDVQWAPYSSTVIAAITAVGRIFIYDFNIDKYEPACAQYVVCCDDNIATRLCFNPWGIKMPLILVGDSRGAVTTLKISPNLRMKPKPPKKTDTSVPIDDFGNEVKKLEKILSYVREPVVLKLPTELQMKQIIE